MEKSICNFYQRNFSVIRRLHFSSVLSAPTYVPPTETPSGFGCHCLSSDSSLSFKYIYMTCLLPHWILCLSFCKCLFPVSNCQCFRPPRKNLLLLQYCSNTSSLYCCPEKSVSGFWNILNRLYIMNYFSTLSYLFYLKKACPFLCLSDSFLYNSEQLIFIVIILVVKTIYKFIFN